MAECLFCGHKFKGDVCDICGTPYNWIYLQYAKERKEQKALAEQGDIKAALRMGQYLFDKRDYAGCIPYLLTAANGGEDEAEALMGQIYYNGLGVVQDLSESIKWHSAAAEHGNADSQFDMGLFYSLGEGVEKDEKKGVEYFKKAAMQEHPKALSSLGKCYYTGIGVTMDKFTAINYFILAAKHGDEDTKVFLEYLQTEGEFPSFEERLNALKIKAEGGNAESQTTLARIYEN